ncbi:MAG TPA: very short patch repair endonuclease [Candidatus Paceibacterota bacterium]|nr:very short patch repair endonuclease [Candidatus Paceibacterota bacterium]
MNRLESRRAYIRDGRSPIPKEGKTSNVMSANKGSNTKPEIALRKALFSLGARGYRLHLKTEHGRPDLVFKGKKVAVFVHGCYWHRCTHCKLPIPKSNQGFWKEKFKRNKERDSRKESGLRKDGWKVVVVWECEIKKNPSLAAKRVRSAIKS